MINGAVTGDSQQPRPQRTARGVKSVNAVPYTQERFLSEVFRQRGVTDHSQNDAVRQAAKAVIKICHRLRIPALQPEGEFRILLAAHFESEQDAWNCHAERSLMSIPLSPRDCISGVRKPTAGGLRVWGDGRHRQQNSGVVGGFLN